jgi:Fe2+ transport system protein FeoA
VTPLPVAPTSGPGPTTCSLCGLVYVPGGDACHERGCPIAIGGCATQHCPRCGYTMPDEERSVTARLVRRLLGRRKEPAGPRTLVDLAAGGSGVVGRLNGAPEILARLTAQGLAPGVTVHLVQRAPTFVVELGETTVALERRVAEAIELRDAGGLQ